MADKRGISTHIQIGGDDYKVDSALLTEAIDAIPRLVVTVERDAELPAPVALLGAEVAFGVEWTGDSAGGRRFSGIVAAAERWADREGTPHLRLVVMPKLHKLEKRTDCRTFQKKSVSSVAQAVIEGGGAGPVRLALSGAYEPRDYVVQYRESDWDFVRRICAEDGIAILFDPVSSEVVLFDDPRGLADAAEPTLRYSALFGFEQPPGSVALVARRRAVRPDKVTVRDYDPTRPRFSLETTVVGKDDGGHELEIYVYPGRSAKEAEVKRRAQVLLDAHQCRREVVTGQVTSLSLRPGERFSIEGHPVAELDGEVLVTSVRIEIEDTRSMQEGGRQRVEVAFEGIPTADSDYRPAPRPPATVAGVQTAVTTGPPGEEIHVDASGRVNIQYPWDRLGKKDDQSSLPVRTLQLATGGSMLLPRVGWEVMVHCTDGDQDLPLVTGRLYNAEKPPPYSLPAHKGRSSIQTATTPGGGSSNEIRTDDTKGSEEMFVNASKDASVKVGNNATESIKANATLKIGGNQTVDVTNSLEVVVGGTQSLTVGGNQKASVETLKVDQCGGDHSLDVGGNRDMKVGGDHKHTVGAGETVEVGGMCTELVVGTLDEQCSSDMSLDVGAVRVALTAGNHTTTIGGDHGEKAAAARVCLVMGTKSSDVAGSQTFKAGGGVINLVSGDRNESAGATLTEVAAGAQIIKAVNVVFEAESVLSLVMGASTLTLTAASASVAGISVKIDGATTETSALIMDN